MPIRWAIVPLLAICIPAWADQSKDGIVPKSFVARVTQYLGDYEGQWDAEVTDNVYDGISRYKLENPVVRLALDAQKHLTVQFFMDTVAAANNEPLDLLGFGCNSKVGPLLTLGSTKTGLDASFVFDWGRCPSRVLAVKSNHLLLSLTQNTTDREDVATFKILRSVKSDNTVYAVGEDGQRREVKIRTKPGGSLYHPEVEYCLMKETNEVEKCFAQKSELKTYLVPFPFPGMTAVWYTKTTPKIEIVQGKKVEYHEASFRRATPTAAN